MREDDRFLFAYPEPRNKCKATLSQSQSVRRVNATCAQLCGDSLSPFLSFSLAAYIREGNVIYVRHSSLLFLPR